MFILTHTHRKRMKALSDTHRARFKEMLLKTRLRTEQRLEDRAIARGMAIVIGEMLTWDELNPHAKQRLAALIASGRAESYFREQHELFMETQRAAESTVHECDARDITWLTADTLANREPARPGSKPC